MNVMQLFKTTQRGVKRAALAAAVCVLFAPLAVNANGTPYYFDVDDITPGFGSPSGSYDMNASALWSTDPTGSATTAAFDPFWDPGVQWTFGATDTDFDGATFTINANSADDWFRINGIVINSTNANITLSGNNKINGSGSDQTWSIATGSTLTVNGDYGNSGGMNWGGNGVGVTFTGGGTFNCETVVGALSGGSTLTFSGPMVNLQASTYSTADNNEELELNWSWVTMANYTLTEGTLNFATTAAANAFRVYGNNNGVLTINGGTIDNTSGLAMVLDLNGGWAKPGTISIGGDFTFAGTDDLDFGNTPVELTATSEITVADKTLKIDGIISGSGFGLTKAGAGTLMLNGVNTYDGDTLVSEGTFGGLGTLAGAATFAAGSKAVFTVTPGGYLGNNSTLMTMTGVMTYNANEVHLNLPADLPGGIYVLAASSATPVANGAFPVPVVDSGSFDGNFTGASISVDTVNNQLILTAATTYTGPVKLRITEVNGGVDVTAGVAFDVVVQAQNGSSVATPVTADTDVTLSITTGSETLGGTVSGTISAGQSQVTISGVTYTKAQSGVVITATRTSGDTLTLSASAPFTVIAGPVSVANSTVTASPSSVTANGTTPATITVTLLDASGNGIPGKTVTLASSRGETDTISAPSGDSDVNGVVTFTVTSSTVGSSVLSATDTTDSNLAITQNATVSFTSTVFGEEQYQSDGASPSPIDVVSGDLLETSVASVTGEPGNGALLHDGNFGEYADPSDGYTTTYTLDITTYPMGYDIKEIRLFSAWGTRATQAYDIKYSLVGAPDTFLLLGTYTGTLPPSADGTLMTRTYDMRAATLDAGPPILTGVAAIQFVIRANGNATLYHEWDVTGAASPPKGSVILLF
jgi:autotransporter-associated beta strand protein